MTAQDYAALGAFLETAVRTALTILRKKLEEMLCH